MGYGQPQKPPPTHSSYRAKLPSILGLVGIVDPVKNFRSCSLLYPQFLGCWSRAALGWDAVDQTVLLSPCQILFL